MTAQHLRPIAGERLKAVQSKVSPSRFSTVCAMSAFLIGLTSLLTQTLLALCLLANRKAATPQ